MMDSEGKRIEFLPNEMETVHSDELKKDTRVPHEGSRPSRGGEYKPTSVQLQETFVGEMIKLPTSTKWEETLTSDSKKGVQVPSTSEDYSAIVKSQKTAKGKQKTLTIECNFGRLGNEMSLYATLYGLARYNNRIPEGLPCYMNDLLSVFEISAGVSDDAPKILKGYSIADVLREQDRHIPEEVTIIRGYPYPESYTFYHDFKEEIKKEFTFKPKFKQYAERMLLNLGANRSFNFYIGMHIRRGDYCRHLRSYRGRMFDMKYLEQAMDYFHQRYDPALFVVASNDRKWCREALRNFTDVIISPEAPTPGHDLALLSHCNHTIMTYGTFGYWSGYLAGGETVYFDDFLSPDSPLIRASPHVLSNYLPGWVGISTTPEGFWENYTLLECS